MIETMSARDKEYAVSLSFNATYAGMSDELIADLTGMELDDVRRLRRATCRRGGPIDRRFQREDELVWVRDSLWKVSEALGKITDVLARGLPASC